MLSRILCQFHTFNDGVILTELYDLIPDIIRRSITYQDDLIIIIFVELVKLNDFLYNASDRFFGTVAGNNKTDKSLTQMKSSPTLASFLRLGLSFDNTVS